MHSKTLLGSLLENCIKKVTKSPSTALGTIYMATNYWGCKLEMLFLLLLSKYLNLRTLIIILGILLERCALFGGVEVWSGSW